MWSSSLVGVYTLVRVRETELWARMTEHLGMTYARVWAAEYSLADLGDRTVVQALAEGEPCKVIWRSVWFALELPLADR